MPLFDTYMIVDWSASSSPGVGRDTVWIALVEHGARRSKAQNPPTRAHGAAEIARILREQKARGRRVLVGFDFAFSYPQGFAKAAGLRGKAKPWRRIWDAIGERFQDKPDNTNNRFDVAADFNLKAGTPELPGPFWGRPHHRGDLTSISMKSLTYPFPVGKGASLGRFRRTEEILREAGWQHIQEVWKLYTAGSLGGQTITGVPVVRALRDSPDFADCAEVWPFETGFTDQPGGGAEGRRPYILLSEIWHGFLRPLDMLEGEHRDERQVLGLARLFERLDKAGKLGRLFDTPSGMSPEQARICVEEEGAILGADPEFLAERPPKRKAPLPYPFYS